MNAPHPRTFPLPCAEALVDESIAARVDAAREALGDVLAAHPVLHEAMPSLFAMSHYLADVVRRYPDNVRRQLEAGAFEVGSAYRAPDAAVLEADLDIMLADALGVAPDALADELEARDGRSLEAPQMKVLRRLRHREMLAILWRDIAGLAALDETLEQLTVLADASIARAESWSHRALVRRHGEPRSREGELQRLIVLGMGKLGGRELNVSSDIDLIAVYAESGESDGRKPISNSEFFQRVSQRMNKLLGATTEDGFVFRVDTRLRPFGASGPPVMNFDGLENYYFTQARDWERYAMIKARAITGIAGQVAELDELIQPFVFRRYLDYGAFEAIRNLKGQIATAVERRGRNLDVKLGAGGIREVEFIGQSFQLVRGGRDKALRVRPIRQVLTLLAERGVLSQDETTALIAAYNHLRRVENGLQMMRDQQTHVLPADATDRQRLLCLLGETDWAAFRDRLDTHRAVVSRVFADVFVWKDESTPADAGEASGVAGDKASGVAGDETTGSLTGVASGEAGGVTSAGEVLSRARLAWGRITAVDATSETRAAALDDYGIALDESAVAVLDSLFRSGYYQRLTARAQQRIDGVMPALMVSALEHAAPGDTFRRIMALVRAVAGRSGYLQVLADRPLVLERVVRLLSQSQWLADRLVAHPIVLDELIASGAMQLPDNPGEILAEARAETERVAELDLGEQMDGLRQFRQGRELRIAVAELEGTLPLMKVSDQLSWLAEAMIDVVLDLVEAPLAARHGRPVCERNGERVHPEVAVLAYGKLGGLELGFGSDLDLVFVHDSTAEASQTDGESVIDNGVYYARLAQKFVHFMTTPTPAGILYEIDLRLRPNGSAGLLVTGIDSFARYQRKEAWTWEHQALVRTRMVRGSDALAERFCTVRAEVLERRRDIEVLRREVAEMREKMRQHLGSDNAAGKAVGKAAGNTMDIKQDAGGIADIEFMVQFLVLAHAHATPALVEWSDNVRILETASKLGVLPQSDARALLEAYLALRAMQHRQVLEGGDTDLVPDAALSDIIAPVLELRQTLLGLPWCVQEPVAQVSAPLPSDRPADT